LALVNVAYNISFGWMARVRSLEAQMLEPMLNEHPVELGLRGREAACARSSRRIRRIRTTSPPLSREIPRP